MRNKHSSRKHPSQALMASAPAPRPDVLHELIPIVLGANTEVRPLWTIRHALQQRFVRKSSEIYVVLGLEIEPFDGSESIAFLFAAPQDASYRTIYNKVPDEEEIRQLAEAVLQGVQDALQEQAAQGIRMTNLLVGLTELGSHPIDSRPGAYRFHAHEMMNLLLDSSNLVEFKH